MNTKESFAKFFKEKQKNAVLSVTLYDLKKLINSNAEYWSTDVEDSCYAIEKCILSINNYKFKYYLVLEEYIKWLKSTGYNVNSTLRKEYFTWTRRVELIKFLQEPHTMEQITDMFAASERTINNDFKKIKEGIDFFGVKLKVDFTTYKKDGKRHTKDNYSYRCSCNPLVLPLNMTELYFITKIVPSFLANDEKHLYASIIKKIYPQLTEYAKTLMKIENITNDKPIEFDFEYEMLKNSILAQICYFEKSESIATFIINVKGEAKELTGKIINHEPLTIKTENEIIEVDFNDFLGVKDLANSYK